MDAASPASRLIGGGSGHGTGSLPPLLRYLNSLVNLFGEIPGGNGALENVRHLPTLGDGRLYTVRKDVRAEALGQRIACKVFKKSLSPMSSSQPEEPEFRRLLQEIRVLTSEKTRRHENIISLINVSFGISSFDPMDICPVARLEEAELGSLELFQSSAPSLDFETRTHLCADTTAGLSALHSSGFVHGALNPSHVLIFRHEQRSYVAKLCGFGSSFVAKDFGACLGRNSGNPWNAPEVNEGCIKDEDVFQSDTFPLGLLLWQTLVHKDPFSTFDLPLDEEAKNAELLAILRLPYLFRFIPLLIEHEVGEMEHEVFDLITEIFACTVRLNPARRSVEKVLELLEQKTSRTLKENPKVAESSIGEPGRMEGNDTAPAGRDLDRDVVSFLFSYLCS